MSKKETETVSTKKVIEKKAKELLAEWRKQPDASLRKELLSLQDHLTKTSIAVSLQKQKDLSQVPKLRRNIARIKTVLMEREMQ